MGSRAAERTLGAPREPVAAKLAAPERETQPIELEESPDRATGSRTC